MTIYELKKLHLSKHPNSQLFDIDTLKFFDETLSKLRVLQDKRLITDICG